MQVSDFSKIVLDNLEEENIQKEKDEEIMAIPNPTNQPVVGVIDTHFNNQVYFHEWVDYKNCLSSDIELTEEDFKHGTAVSSIIVDGPALNPKLEDHCGRFQVRHFGVATAKDLALFLC